MMPDSVIADAANQPEDTLDLSQMLGAPPTPNPAQAAQAKGGAWKQYAPLMALLPIAAAKGGRMGVAALLNGVQQAQQRAQAEQMRAEQMGMQRQQFDATQQARQQAIQASADQQRQRMAQELLRDLASGLQGAEDEQQAQQFIDAMLPAIQQAGIPMGRIEAMRMQLAAPSRMTQRRAKKALDAVLTTTAKEDLGSVRVNFDGQALGVDELAALANGAGGMQVTRAPKPAPEPKALTFSTTPQEVLVDGKPSVVRLGSDGKTYTMQGELVTGRIDPRPERASSGGSGGGERALTPTARANIIGSRRNQWTRFSKAVTDRQQSIAKLDAGVAALDRGNRNAATQAIILAFNKLQDETSVVREGEYARAEQLAPIQSRIEAAIVRFTQGGGSLTEADLRSLAYEAKQTAQALERVSNDAARNVRQSIEEELDDYQIPHSRVFGGSTIGTAPKSAPIKVGRFSVEVED